MLDGHLDQDVPRPVHGKTLPEAAGEDQLHYADQAGAPSSTTRSSALSPRTIMLSKKSFRRRWTPTSRCRD
jgi:hypothetical protein